MKEKGMQEIKVFLVEDESLIRNGIKDGIAWEKEGFVFAGAASDGELAYLMILDTKPDILVTDIKMPFMDGLELSRLVKNELPDIKILILSGYDEFSLAKEAIEIGVTKYLLKPISMANLLKALHEVTGQIQKEWEEKEVLQQYSEETRKNTEYEKMRFFTQLMSGMMPLPQVLEKGRRFDMNLSAQYYNVILFNMLMGDGQAIYKEQRLQAGEAITNLTYGMEHVYSFRRAEEGWAFLLTADSEAQMEMYTGELKDKLEQLLDRFEAVEYFGGIGRPVSRVRELHSAFQEAEQAFAGRFILQVNQILSIGELRELNEEVGFEINSYENIGNARIGIEKFLNNGMRDEIYDFTESYVKKIPENNLKSMMLRQYIIMDIYVAAMAFMEKLNVGEIPYSGDDFQTDAQKIRTREDMSAYIQKMLKLVLDLRDELSDRRYADIIHKAKEIIATSYMTEDISLNSVAAKVGMSASYFSCIFSKEAGRTFVECLTETRMDRAKELLVCSAMKTSEIGFEVGYKDPHYFSYIFKKTQGCSPKEYRNNRKVCVGREPEGKEAHKL
ncbi:response regulator [Laedolimicola sp.]|uniref:response regulator n=1 Tax=Laedolimicola sp. TaxID=2981663 RepID=UPI003F820FDA